MLAKMHPEDVKAILRKRFGSVFSFERAKGLPHKGVSNHFSGRTSQRVAEAIEQEIRLSKTASSKRRSSDLSDDRRTDSDAHCLNAVAR